MRAGALIARLLTVLMLTVLAGMAWAAEAQPIAPAGSQIGFTFKQYGVGVDVEFKRFSGDARFDPDDPAASRAIVAVEVASVSTGDEDADAEVVKPTWLDAARFPSARFESTRVRALGGGRYEADGRLTLKGTTREVTVPFILNSAADGTLVISGGFPVRRSDFKIGEGDWSTFDVVADEVSVHFRVVAAAPAADTLH